jgi:hypothetical protein
MQRAELGLGHLPGRAGSRLDAGALSTGHAISL